MAKSTTPKRAVGEIIKEARDIHGLTQDEFAAPLGLKGATISAIERGVTVTSRGKTKRLVTGRINELMGTKYTIPELFGMGDSQTNFKRAASSRNVA